MPSTSSREDIRRAPLVPTVNRRNHLWRAALGAQLSVASLTATFRVGASERAEPERLPVAPSSSAQLPEKTYRDYNAPERSPRLSNHVRALANLGFQNWAIWQLSWLRGVDWTPVTRDSLGNNLRSGFTFDQDELQTNFFGHPYHGGLNFNSARAAGLGFWTSAAYTFAGSLAWELFAEIEPPSINDLLVTSLSGLMLGEITFRLSSELLDDGSSGGFRLLRELGATAVNPMRGFNRLYMGDAFQSGPSPIRHSLDAALALGVEGMEARAEGAAEVRRPTLLLAVDISYGDPLNLAAARLEPFELFELYAAVSLFDDELASAQVYTTGLLYGSSQERELGRLCLKNEVLGLAMTYEFQGSNLATYGGVGIGPAYYLASLSRPWRSVRLGLGIDWVPILGVTTSPPRAGERPYDFGIGAAAWMSMRWDLDRFGKVHWRTRHYAAGMFDDTDGINYVGASRLSYEVDAVDGLGFGIAPMVIYHRRVGTEPESSILQTQAQLYFRLRL